jgi:hypothetical protein
MSTRFVKRWLGSTTMRGFADGMNRRRTSSGLSNPLGNTDGKRISSTKMNTMLGPPIDLCCGACGGLEDPEVGPSGATELVLASDQGQKRA